MPNMNGHEAFNEITKVRPGIKTIFLSGHAPEIILQKVSLTDGAHLVSKPISPMELIRKVRSVLDSK
jgi:CheY-like chemotaxis protein